MTDDGFNEVGVIHEVGILLTNLALIGSGVALAILGHTDVGNLCIGSGTGLAAGAGPRTVRSLRSKLQAPKVRV